MQSECFFLLVPFLLLLVRHLLLLAMHLFLIASCYWVGAHRHECFLHAHLVTREWDAFASDGLRLKHPTDRARLCFQEHQAASLVTQKRMARRRQGFW